MEQAGRIEPINFTKNNEQKYLEYLKLINMMRVDLKRFNKKSFGRFSQKTSWLVINAQPKKAGFCGIIRLEIQTGGVYATNLQH